MNSRIFALTLMMVLTAPQLAHALIASEVTLSGGYYRDYTEKYRAPVFFYWNLNHIASNDVSTTIDLGANNNLIEDQWGFYVYQGYVNVPLGAGFENAPGHKSRVQLGRQWLMEGFEMTILDGVQAPLYWSANGGVTLFGGASYFMQQNRVDFDSQVYGGTAHQRFLGVLWKAGYEAKRRNSDTPGARTLTENLAHGSAMFTLEKFPLKPTVLLKGQWDLDQSAYDQGYADLSLYPHDRLSVGGTYSKRRASAVDPLQSSFVYELFSISPVQSVSGYATWLPVEDFRVEGTIRRATYTASVWAGEQTGDEQELTVSWMRGRSTITPGIFHLASYGGDLTQGSLSYRFDWSDSTAVKLQGAAAKIKKINGIEAPAYSGRAGLEFRPLQRFSVLVQGEAESNHFFKLDARAIAFLTYLLY